MLVSRTAANPIREMLAPTPDTANNQAKERFNHAVKMKQRVAAATGNEVEGSQPSSARSLVGMDLT